MLVYSGFPIRIKKKKHKETSKFLEKRKKSLPNCSLVFPWYFYPFNVLKTLIVLNCASISIELMKIIPLAQ